MDNSIRGRNCRDQFRGVTSRRRTQIRGFASDDGDRINACKPKKVVLTVNYFTLGMPLAQCKFNEGASLHAIEQLRANYPHLADDYLSFLLKSDGGEGSVGISPGYFQIWRASEVARFSTEYELPKYLPDYVAIGSDGGGDLYVFPISGNPPGLFIVPAIGMEARYVELVAPTFSHFVSQFGKQWHA